MPNTGLALTVADYGFYSLMGLLVVFFALILLMAVIKIMTFSPKQAEPAAEAAASGAPVATGDKPLAPGTAGDLKLYDTDPRDAAMVMAIVADELKKPLNELRFISIREVK